VLSAGKESKVTVMKKYADGSGTNETEQKYAAKEDPAQKKPPLTDAPNACDNMPPDGDVPGEPDEYARSIEAVSHYAPGGIFSYSAESDEEFAFISDNMLAFLGYTSEEFRSKFSNRFSLMVWYEDRKRTIDEINRQIALSPFDTCEYRIEKKDGSIVWVHDEGHIVTDRNGKRWFYVVVVDITDSVNARREMLIRNRELETTVRDLQTTLDNIPGGIRVFRLLGDSAICVNANQYLADMFGVAKSELLSETIEQSEKRMHPADIARHRSDMMAVLPVKRWIEGSYRFLDKKSDDFRWYHVEAKLVGNPDGEGLAYVHYTDVDDLKTAKESERERQTQYELAIKGAHLAVWEYDIASSKLTVPAGENSSFARERYGFDSEVVENVPECMLPMGVSDEDRENFLRLYDEVRSGSEYASADIWFRKYPGDSPHCDRISYYVVKDESGKPVRAYGVGSDITAAKLEQHRFSQSIQSILTANPEALCVFRINLTENICYEGHGASSYIMNSLQSDTADGVFLNAMRLVTLPEDKKRCADFFSRSHLVRGFAEGKSSLHIDYRRKDETGELFWVRTYINLLKNPGTGDIEGAIYSIDISREVRQREIFDIITGEEYDLIALLDLNSNTVEALHLSSMLPKAYNASFRKVGACCSFDDMRRNGAEKWVDAGDRTKYLEGTSSQKIREQLDKYGRYELTVRGCLPERGIVYRKLQHYYLDNIKKSVLIIDSDVTSMYIQQQKEIEHAKAETKHVQDIMDSINAGISVLVMSDPDHLSIEYVNRSMFRILSFPEYDNRLAFDGNVNDSVLQNYLKDGFSGVHPDDLGRVKKTFRDNYDSEEFTIEDYRTLGGDGRYHWLRETVSLRQSAQGMRKFYATYLDVGEEVRLRRERDRQFREEKRLRIEATSANAAKSEFLSRMSHDIRTPLNGIIGMAYIAREEDNPPRTADCLRKIDTSSKFLLGLINDILDMSKAESEKIELHPEPYPPEEFRSYLNAVFKPLCDEKGQTFTVEMRLPDGMVPIFDKLRINQVIFNLLSNAVKYTHEGGRIQFLAHFDRVGTGPKLSAHIDICDTGIGISDKFQKVIFEPFVQEGRADPSEIRGSGLGLAIAKKMTDLMGGNISVKSKLGSGTTFTITMLVDSVPAHKVSYGHKPGGLLNQADLAGKKILLCEDNRLNQEIAQALLASRNIVANIADNGRRGVEMFEDSDEGFYDAILMDIRMPVMNGYEAAAEIRRLRRSDAQSVPIIAMSADAYAEDVKKCLDAGMNAHIPKPVDPEMLFGTLYKYIVTRR
jgi:PAS domain S-box-containing protein